MKKIKLAAMSRRLMAFLIIIVVSFGFFTMPGYAATPGRTIRVGCFPLNGFYNIASDGKVSGYGADYTDVIFSHVGWDYEYVKYDSWVDALDALSKNEIDILAPAQHTQERDDTYTFDSYPIGTEYGALLTLSTNDDLIYEDYTAFDGLNVGCVSTVVFLDDFNEYEARNNFSVNLIYYKDTPALVAALNAGEIDAMVANMMVKTDTMKLLARFGAAPFYYMFSPKAADLRVELNQIIDKVTSNHLDLQMQLSNEYFSDFNNIPFSKEELDYISQCGTLNIACGSHYPPFSYVDGKTGEIDGVGRAILEKISDITGLQFDYKPIPFNNDVQTFLKEENIAVIEGVENDEHSRLHGNSFTDSYLNLSKYFIGLKDSTLDVNTNMKIAVLSAAESRISEWNRLYPKFQFIRYASIDDCIKAIRSKEVDFILEDRYSMENVLAAPKNEDLSIIPTEVISSNICFKILLGDDETEILASILNKAIREIPEDDKERFISDYTQKNRYKYSAVDFLYQYRIQIIFVFVLLAVTIVALAFVYNARRKVRLAIKGNEMKLRNITNNIKGGVVVLKANEGLNITYANDGFLELIGCTREQFEEKKNGSYLAYVHPDDLSEVQSAIESDKKELSIELRVLKIDGGYVPALFNCTAGHTAEGNKELYCVIMDMTEQNKLLEQLRIEKRRTDLILDRVDEIFYEINLQDHMITTSNSFREKLGWTLPDRIPSNKGSNYSRMWHTDTENLEKLQLSTKEMVDTKKPVSATVKMESKIEEKYIWCEVLQYPILAEDGSVLTVIGLIRNIDEQVSERERLIEQAQHDQLTGLYNKEAFETIVTDTLASMPGQNHALIFIDLDHFKNLNDTLGHMMGDRAICEAADKLKIIFSNYDVLSRFGGDEFCIFVKNIPVDTLRGKMDWLVDKIHEDYHGEKGDVHITCSCGIACTEQVGFEYKNLMQKADEALYYSKETGRDRFTFYRDIKKQGA